MDFFFRSEASGNCLFSSVSIYLTGSNSLVEDLRAATATELYLNSNIYRYHPYLVSLSQNYPNIFRCPENVLMMSASQKSIDSNKKLSDLVKEEAINICENKVWSSFLCILALASVTSRKINCCYPDIGTIRFRTMFNCIIQSRIPQMSVEDIHILFSYEGVLRSSAFQHNHYVPIIFLLFFIFHFLFFSLNKKGDQKSKKSCLNSQNTQKRLAFLGKHSSKKSNNLPCNQPQVLKNTQMKLSI